MRIESLTICGFRCFPNEPVTIQLDKGLTCFVGPNASGKTAAMAALVKLFGETQYDRLIRASDFHLRPGEQLDTNDKTKQRTLSLEARVHIDLKEPALPRVFNEMTVDEPGASPYCRIRLSATWDHDGTAEGEVGQKTEWIRSSAETAPENESKHAVAPSQRSLIRVVYVSASRDLQHIRSSSSAALGRLFKSIAWDGRDAVVKQKVKELNDQLQDLDAMKTVAQHLQDSWKRVYDGRIAQNIKLEGAAPNLSTLMESVAPAFAPNEQGETVQSNQLSDGLRSLFALSLPLGVHRVEREVASAARTDTGFDRGLVDALAHLTIFAVEEPENHLSPHYVGKVVTELTRAAATDDTQVVLSSHAPSILGRVEPTAVRYFLGGEHRDTTRVSQLHLPEEQSEAFKYVREGVRRHPELYFSRFVILCEGASEEIILRKLFEAAGDPLDSAFVSVVPLGGRHVNHFWRLLKQMEIPFATLLDLDREKPGGGWGRIQDVRDQLVRLHADAPNTLKLHYASGHVGWLHEPQFRDLRSEDDRLDIRALRAWVEFLKSRFSVFFVEPLDIDFAMLTEFPAVYQHQAAQGPKATALVAAQQVMKTVLWPEKDPPTTLGRSYSDEEALLFPWYRLLFLANSKPVAHSLAMAKIEAATLLNGAPGVLLEVMQAVRTSLKSRE